MAARHLLSRTDGRDVAALACAPETASISALKASSLQRHKACTVASKAATVCADSARAVRGNAAAAWSLHFLMLARQRSSRMTFTGIPAAGAGFVDQLQEDLHLGTRRAFTAGNIAPVVSVDIGKPGAQRSQSPLFAACERVQ